MRWCEQRAGKVGRGLLSDVGGWDGIVAGMDALHDDTFGDVGAFVHGLFSTANATEREESILSVAACSLCPKLI